MHQFIRLPTVNEKTSLYSVLQSCAATVRLFRDTEHLLCQVLELLKKNDRDKSLILELMRSSYYVKKVNNFIDKIF